MFEQFEKVENADLKQFSTMRTGGRAKVIVFPKNINEIKKILKICQNNQQKLLILGNGSNILFDDDGFDGVIISLKHFNDIKILHNRKIEEEFLFDKKYEKRLKKTIVEVGAGINLFQLNQKMAELGFSGLEWSYGIPATLGGFLVMNGGAFGHEIGEFVKEVKVLENGKVRWLKKTEIEFSYRHSNLQKNVILGAKLQLFCEKTEKILQKMDFFLKEKQKTQPCEFPSLGSVFKRIEGEKTIFPAKFIDNNGFKGVRINGAEISTKHAGFIINRGEATSADVLALIEMLEKEFREQGLNVEREIIVIKND